MKIYHSSDKGCTLAQVGGKGFNLFRLKQPGINVPDFVVIDQGELEKIIPAQHKANLNLPEIYASIDRHVIGPELRQFLTACFPGIQEKMFAVRSSAVMEDGQDKSFAGQFETYLYVSFDDIPKYVKAVWKSNFSERVFAYLKANNLDPAFGIGVVIQEMIDPDVSGVAFGIDPSTGAKDSAVICSVYGTGEGLVSGSLNADTFKLNGDKTEQTIAEKTVAARRSGSGEIKLEDVPSANHMKPSLTEIQINEIKAMLKRLEEKLGSPQDVEFAYKNNQLYLLQTRPVTAVINTHNNATISVPQNRIIWDNSNIIESYPGVTTPLTFSYISSAYKQVYLQLAAIMGASAQTLRANESTFANMLGMINGRVYYNLLSWYKVLSLFPGYRLNARFMENMMGVKERFDLPPQKISITGAVFRTTIMVFKIAMNLFSIKRTTRKFYADVNRALADVKKKNLESMSAFELRETWLALDADLTPKWKAPLINDSFAMIYFGKLQKLVEKYKISSNKNIQNDLLCGSKDIISVEPIHRSIALATEIGKHQELKELFTTLPATEIREELQRRRQEHQYGEIAEKIDLYIDKFGERCVGELKLETISFKQDPTLFIATLKSFVIQNITTSSTASTIDKDLRDAAEAELNHALKFKPYKKWKLKKTLEKARYFVSNRENLRYERTRVFGITREIFSLIGARFESENVLKNHRDIFYLTKEEIFAFIDGTSVDKDLKGLVSFRKAEYEAFEEMQAPADRITTYGTVNASNDFYKSGDPAPGDNKPGLKGLGCCPGIVKAKVRLVKHPKEVESLSGDILVTSSTDPGWVTLFPTASGIIVERGSLLSHSAIVSREMGIPCIVGVNGLLKTLKTGDLVEMNGSTGTIKIIGDE